MTKLKNLVKMQIKDQIDHNHTGRHLNEKEEDDDFHLKL